MSLGNGATSAPSASTFRVTRVRYQRDPAMDNLRDAIDWLEAHWGEQLEAPDRLHRHDTEGELGGLAYSPEFAAVLSWSPRTVVRWRMTTECHHPMTAGRQQDCPECLGSCVKEVASDRFPYPMTTALTTLARSPSKPPHPVVLLRELAVRSWDARTTASVMGLAWEQAGALMLRAIRKVHARYQAAPIHRSWVDLSESQRNAEEAAA